MKKQRREEVIFREMHRKQPADERRAGSWE